MFNRLNVFKDELVIKSWNGGKGILHYCFVKNSLVVGLCCVFVMTSMGTSVHVPLRIPVPLAAQGAWLYVGGSESGNYGAIQSALDVARDGDGVFVYAGVYRESQVLVTSLILAGEDQRSMVVDVHRRGTPLMVQADQCVIPVFTVTNCSILHEGYASLLMVLACEATQVYDNSFLQVEDDVFNRRGGVLIRKGSSNEIVDNNFWCVSVQYFTVAITLYGGCQENRIHHNTFEGWYFRVEESYECTAHTIDMCMIQNNRIGVSVFGEYERILNTTFTSNDHQTIAIMGGEYIIFGNKLLDNGSGLANQSEGGPGVFVNRSGHLTIQRNSIIRSGGPALYLYRSYNNIITENNFIENGAERLLNAYMYTHLQDLFKHNTWSLNYWSDTVRLVTGWQLIPTGLQILAYFDYVLTVPFVTFDKTPTAAPCDLTENVIKKMNSGLRCMKPNDLIECLWVMDAEHQKIYRGGTGMIPFTAGVSCPVREFCIHDVVINNGGMGGNLGGAPSNSCYQRQCYNLA